VIPEKGPLNGCGCGGGGGGVFSKMWYSAFVVHYRVNTEWLTRANDLCDGRGTLPQLNCCMLGKQTVFTG